MPVCRCFGRRPQSGRSTSCRVITILFASVSLFLFQNRNVDAQTSFYEKILASKKIEVTPKSLAKYLRELHPTRQQRKKIQSLIRQLGSGRFVVRERATSELSAMLWPPTAALVAAIKDGDLEVSRRARTIRGVRKRETLKILHSAFQVIAAKKTPGVISELLAAIPLCKQHYLLPSARRAILEAARPQDAAILRNAVYHKNVQVRIAAISTLGRTQKHEARKDLYPLLKDSKDMVRMAAARAIADFGDRKCLATLLALLDSDDMSVRIAAATTLRQLSGKQLGFAAYDTAKRRAKSVSEWRAWINSEGRTAKLRFPLKKTGSSYLGGKTLLAYGDQIHKVAEYDSKGKEIWSYAARNPRSAEKLPNGNVLIAECRGNRVTEVNPEGKVVWQYKMTWPLSAKLLANGNILIAGYKDASQVVEVNREGVVVWKYAVRGYCCEAHRLENGNTLIASYTASVMEVTPMGSVVWEYRSPHCHGCQPLPNGNVLIAIRSPGKVVEINREKKIVWESRHPGAVDAFRLPNGNTLISGSNQFVEMTPNRNIVWSKRGCVYGTARR